MKRTPFTPRAWRAMPDQAKRQKPELPHGFIERLTASAGADLWKRGRLPAVEHAAEQAIAKHAEHYLTGRARFPLLGLRETVAMLQDGDNRQLGGFGSFIKKAVKSVGSVVGKVTSIAAPIVGSTGIPVISNLAGGVLGATGAALQGGNRTDIAAAGGAAAAGTAVPKPLYATNDAGQLVQVGMTGGTQYPTAPAEKLIFGLPEKYLPYVALMFAALILRK